MSGGIVIGTDPTKKKYYWTVDDDTHVLLIGTTRSGKSRRVIMPSIWHLAKTGESMVICDVFGFINFEEAIKCLTPKQQEEL